MLQPNSAMNSLIILTLRLTQRLSIFLIFSSQKNLEQHVPGATHSAGHCLDVFITRRELCVRSVVVNPPTFSDHSTIVAQVDLRVPQDHTKKHLVRHCWRQFDLDRFIGDLELSPLVCDLTGDDDVN